MKIETFGSICSGCGFQEMAIKKVYPGIEIKFHSDIDSVANKAYDLIHGDIKQLGDFTQVLFPGYVDFLFSSTPCFTGEQQIYTKEGYKNIKDIKLNDYVLTDKNKFEKVIDFGVKKSSVYLLKAQGVLQTETTKNHPYLILREGKEEYRQMKK